MKKLFEVEITLYVMAESESSINLSGVDLSACDVEASEADCVASHWWDCIPFGSTDDKTCGEIITEMRGKAQP